MKSYLQEAVAQKLPDAAEATIDKAHYYRQFLHGYYQFDCVVEKGVTRSAKFYIPEGSIYNQPTVFVGVPGGKNSWNFMVESGWKALADEYGLYLILMEAADESGWKGDQADEAYLNALNNDISLRPMFCAFQPNFYAAAYGDCADVVAHQSRKAPRAYAAVALIGSTGMTEAEEKMLCEIQSRVPGVTFSAVQWPAWIVSAKTEDAESEKNREREIAYYRRADHSEETGSTTETKTVWMPKQGGDDDEHWCAKVVADRREWETCVNRTYSEAILTELFDGIYRYPGNNNGALRKAGNIYERGFKKFSANVWGGYYCDKRDTYHREWYVYLPDSAPKKEIPVVFVFHGAGGGGDEIADRIGWSTVADRHGFMIVMMSASEPNEVREVSDIRTNNIFRAMWNTGNPQPERPADMLFLDYVYNWVKEYYPVDLSRVYGSGQSSGGMMSWACAAYRPDYFAAVAPFSARDIDLEAILRGEPENPPVESSEIPIMANLGCCDAAFKGGFAGSEKLVDYWCDRYQLTKHWADYTYMDEGKNCSYQKGKMTHYVFETEDKVPMLHLSETSTKAHATWPSECEEVWNEFFTKFTKDPKTKTLSYHA